MHWDENVTQFAKRYWTIYSQIERSSDVVAVNAFKQALLPTCPLRAKLAGNPPATVKALMARVNKYVAQEEDAARSYESFGLAQPAVAYPVVAQQEVPVRTPPSLPVSRPRRHEVRQQPRDDQRPRRRSPERAYQREPRSRNRDQGAATGLSH